MTIKALKSARDFTNEVHGKNSKIHVSQDFGTTSLK